MAGQYKRSFKAYSAWNYQKEIEDLNKESEKGWQLVRGGCFHSRFKKNPNIRYRYQIDYQGKIEDMGRYIETYREQGWEFINVTFNGWCYFRKLYDPSLPDEEYEIFTDRSSMQEMNGRWAKLAAVLSVFLGIFAVLRLIHMIQMPKLRTLVQLVTFVFILAIFIRGIVIMRNPEKSKNVGWDGILLTIFFLVLIAGNIGAIYLVESRPYCDSVFDTEEAQAIPAESDGAFVWNSMDVTYGDYYYIDVEIAADAPICFSIVSEAGEVVYTVRDLAVQQSDVQLYLKRGTYNVCFSDYPGGALHITFGVE